MRGETVKLSSFATFMFATRTSASAATRKTGEEVPIPPRRVATFKASNVLKSRILKAHNSGKPKGK
ncbi:MAG: HU family DNA-binding protein [Rhizobiaceae bacterium]